MQKERCQSQINQNFGTVCYTEVCLTISRLAAKLSALAKKFWGHRVCIQYLLTPFDLKSPNPFLTFHQRHLARSFYGLSSKRCGLATTNSYLTTNQGFCKRFNAWPSLIWKEPRGPQWTEGLRARVSIVTTWKKHHTSSYILTRPKHFQKIAHFMFNRLLLPL